MKISSKFHDFYDHALAYGQDDDLVYVRVKQEEKLPGNDRYSYPIPVFQPDAYSYDECSLEGVGTAYGFSIAFCGKFYGAIAFGAWEKHQFFYSMEAIDKYVRTLPQKIQDGFFGEPTGDYWKDRRPGAYRGLRRRTIGEFFGLPEYRRPDHPWRRGAWYDPEYWQKRAKPSAKPVSALLSSAETVP